MALDCVLIMRVSNEQLDNNCGIRPIPGNGQMETGERRAAAGSSKVSFEYSVDWEKVEAQAEAEFAAQRARLANGWTMRTIRSRRFSTMSPGWWYVISVDLPASTPYLCVTS